MLRKMGNKLEHLEEDIFEGGRSREVVRDISNVKQEIINFRKVVRPQRAALRDLERTKRYMPEDLEIYFDDINDASERVWDMLENFKEVVEALESTNEAVLSHELNDTFRDPDRDQRRGPAAHAHREHLGHEQPRAGRGLDRGLLDRGRDHGRLPGRHGPALPPPRLAVAARDGGRLLGAPPAVV